MVMCGLHDVLDRGVREATPCAGLVCDALPAMAREWRPRASRSDARDWRASGSILEVCKQGADVLGMDRGQNSGWLWTIPCRSNHSASSQACLRTSGGADPRRHDNRPSVLQQGLRQSRASRSCPHAREHSSVLGNSHALQARTSLRRGQHLHQTERASSMQGLYGCRTAEVSAAQRMRLA